MMRIDSVAAQPDRAGRYFVKFEDGTDMRLYRQTVEDFALYTGKELTETELAQLREAAGKMSAKMRAVRIVSASSVSKRDLMQRLVQKGEDPAQAKEAVQWMEELHLLNDRNTAEQVVHSCIAKGYGLQRAKQALYEKQIPKSLWEEALEGYPDQQDAITVFLSQRIKDPADSKQVRRAIEAALRRGHSYGQVKRALEHIGTESDFEEEY